jgi:hypothetical protein
LSIYSNKETTADGAVSFHIKIKIDAMPRSDANYEVGFEPGPD